LHLKPVFLARALNPLIYDYERGKSGGRGGIVREFIIPIVTYLKHNSVGPYIESIGRFSAQ
jgi:hypothetical protein